MRRKLFLLLGMMVVVGASLLALPEATPKAGEIYVWVEREYSSWDNPLQSEFIVNGTTVNIYTSEKFEPVGQHLKTEWNTITIKTTPQEPANSANQLIFRIGPMHKDPKDSRRMVMEPVLWEFRNGTDWSFKDGMYSHPLGPGVKEVTLTYNVYWAGMEREQGELKAGDFVLQGKPTFSSWNTPVVGTVFVNGTPLNSFLLADRQIIITSLLKPGKNEIKLVSSRVKNSISNNDVEFAIAGPAEWYVDKNQYVLPPLTAFKAMQGWTKNPKSGQLVNRAKPEAETIERLIPFMMKEPAGKP